MWAGRHRSYVAPRPWRRRCVIQVLASYGYPFAGEKEIAAQRKQGMRIANLAVDLPSSPKHNGPYWATNGRPSPDPQEFRMSSSTTLPADASARLAMLAQMLERSSSKPESDNRQDRPEAPRPESAPR